MSHKHQPQMIKTAEIFLHTCEALPQEFNSTITTLTPNQFGILEIEINETAPTQIPQDILFSIDTSGSMDDKCKDNRSKMQHAKNTTKNIMKVLSQLENPKISICIHGFDSTVKEILEWLNIEKKDIPAIFEKIETLEPCDSTNIEMALKKANESFEKMNRDSQEQRQNKSQKTHIFLTDGNATEGETNANKLVEILQNGAPRPSPTEDSTQVNYTNQNIFVGFGNDHNGHLLQKFASSTNGPYYFVDDIEHTGLVFGEIIHGIVYKALVEIEIEIENGEIYDYTSNIWSNKLNVPSLVENAKKTYHVRTLPHQSQPDSQQPIRATIKAKIYDTNERIEKHISPSQGKNVFNYMLRQRTQELLYEANEVSREDEEFETKNDVLLFAETKFLETTTNSEKRKEIKDKKSEIRKKLKDFSTIISNYMKENKLENDEFYRTIHEDIKTTYRTINSSSAIMYSAARQHSQGRQLTYSPKYGEEENSEPDDSQYDDTFYLSPIQIGERKIPHVKRNSKMNYRSNYRSILDDIINDSSDDEIFKHLTMQNATPSKLKLMRDVSYVSPPSSPRIIQTPRAPKLSRIITCVGISKTTPYFDFPIPKSNSPSLSQRSSPPPIPENENIKIEELEPLTEMDRILFEKKHSKKTNNLSEPLNQLQYQSW